jgi:hypothetical protein
MDKPGHYQVPEHCEVLDPDALASYLNYKRGTVLTHLSRERWDKIPPPSRRLAMGPIWYLGAVDQWRKDNNREKAAPRLTPSDTTTGHHKTP